MIEHSKIQVKAVTGSLVNHYLTEIGVHFHGSPVNKSGENSQVELKAHCDKLQNHDG